MIDPKKIEEWKRLARTPAPCTCGRALVSPTGIPVHPSTPDGWLHTVGGCGPVGEVLARPAGQPALVCEAFPMLLAERGEHLALLREVEWSGYGTFGPSRRIKGACPICGGINPSEFERHTKALREWEPVPVSPVSGHVAGCRLAAVLR